MVSCPHCNSIKIRKKGIRGGNQRYKCNICKKWFSIPVKDCEDEHKRGFIEKSDDPNHKELTTTIDEKPTTVDELLKLFNVDTEVWKVERYLINRWEMGRKDRNVGLTYENGKAKGHITDSGKVNV